jgi:hypothetical protein
MPSNKKKKGKKKSGKAPGAEPLAHPSSDDLMHSIFNSEGLSSEEKVEKLREWVAEGGGSINEKANHAYLDGFGLSLMTHESIQEGECIMSLPPALLLSSEQAKTRFEVDFSNDFARLAFLLLCESASESSLWDPYFATLPQSFTMPFAWSEKTLRLLKPSHLYELVNSEKTIAQQEFANLKPVALETGMISNTGCTEARYRWVKQVLWSRAFQVEGQGLCLCPAIDIANSVVNGANAKIVANGNAFKLVCTSSIDAGEQVLLCYDPDSHTLETLERYGYIDMSSNVHAVEFDLKLLWKFFPQKEADLPKWKHALIHECVQESSSMARAEPTLLLTYPTDACPLMCAIRGLHMADDAAGDDSGSQYEVAREPLAGNEEACVAVLLEIIHARLRRYPADVPKVTSEHEDLAGKVLQYEKFILSTAAQSLSP